MLVTPIVFKKYLLGAIQLINKAGGNEFTEKDESAVKEIARVLGIAFFKNQKIAERKRATKFDYLITHNIITEKELNEAMATAVHRQRWGETSVLSHLQFVEFVSPGGNSRRSAAECFEK